MWIYLHRETFAAIMGTVFTEESSGSIPVGNKKENTCCRFRQAKHLLYDGIERHLDIIMGPIQEPQWRKGTLLEQGYIPYVFPHTRREIEGDARD